ncbi:hypothetical protein SS50377_26788 [Spironucleus salmonicida]|uniref:Uncharacterized protein n=1 Tax=Spironucleus salmonicida TaxID=348837 RepID=V6LXA2_9EUKA|nr:hypothetical protein SS50377_26788 [Spironucleus salmonicida]|eukprot:EST49257.1 Hypothetical protein SS50377_10478 [Spironucleus salmonicida]
MDQLYDRQIRALQPELNSYLQGLRINILGDFFLAQEICKHFVLLGVREIGFQGDLPYQLTSKTIINKFCDNPDFIINCSGSIIEVAQDNILNVFVLDNKLIVSKTEAYITDTSYIQSNIVGAVFHYWFIHFLKTDKTKNRYEINL